MKKLTFSKKILLIFFSSIAFTILFSFFFIHYLYSKLYLNSIEESILYQGQRTASHYHYGELSDEIIEKIHWYNIVSEYEIIVVDDLDQLSSYFPYQINYETLVDADDRKQLEKGGYVKKQGYVEELNREVLGAIFPIKAENGLIGFIYIYVPLAAIQDVFQESIPLILIVGSIFFLLLFIVINRAWRSLFKPLKDLQKMSYEVSRGNYTNRISAIRNDEIGQLTDAFNQMSLSLQEQEERKKEFISNLVHEMRTPLTYIGGYTHALQDRIYNSPEEAESYLMTIEKETERLSKLINDLVDLNYMQEEMYSLVREPIAIAQLLYDTAELFAIHLHDKQLELTMEVEDELIMMGDSKRLQQVFYNTIDNAVKYAQPKSKIAIQLSASRKHVVYQITNEGIGISKQDIGRIGERFFRTDKARNRTTGGTGLGLSIVKAIVRLHHGTFEIWSSDENETAVKITFPSDDTSEEVQ